MPFAAEEAWSLPPVDSTAGCGVRSTNFEGWKAEELFNDWIGVIIVPQPGGRVMQVRFGDTSHPIRWSVQSVTQYNPSDAQDGTRYHHDFWAFAPPNLGSGFGDGYPVRAGLADDPSFSVHDGLFRLHWLYLENEVWRLRCRVDCDRSMMLRNLA